MANKIPYQTLFIVLLLIGLLTIIISLRNFGYLAMMSITSDIPLSFNSAYQLDIMDIFNIMVGTTITYISYLGLKKRK